MCFRGSLGVSLNLTLTIFQPFDFGQAHFFNWKDWHVFGSDLKIKFCVHEHILTHFSMLKIVWIQNFQQKFQNQGSIYVQSPTTNKIIYLTIKFGSVLNFSKTFTLAKLKNMNAFSWFYFEGPDIREIQKFTLSSVFLWASFHALTPLSVLL
jgi:hypothetical protein